MAETLQRKAKLRAAVRSEGPPLLFLLAAAVLFFWKSTLGGKVLLPVDDLFQFQPWAAYAPAGFQGPHNGLIADSILENFGWKTFLLESIRNRQLPLWNPYILAGTPFFAPGQASVLYPFVLLWLIVPIAYAYGYFAALHLFFAGAFSYAFLRVAGTSRTGGTSGALAFMFSGRLVTSVLWPQMIGAIVYLPLLLLLVELAVRQARTRWPVIPVVAGAAVLGLSILAGHIEASVYVIAAIGLYALGRIVAEVSSCRDRRGWLMARAGLGALGLGLLGSGVAAVQLLPFYEVGALNFRSGAVSYQDVVGFALKLPQLLTFLMPDFYGNPVIHWAPYWGPKDYVEQAAYIGVAPLLLAGATLWPIAARLFARAGWRQAPRDGEERTLPVVAALWAVVAVSLLLAFGTPLYKLIFYLLPGFNQIHSPFRWLIPYTGAMALLAGFGYDVVRTRLSAARPLLLLLALATLGGLALWVRVVVPHVPEAERQLEVRNYAIFLGLIVACAAIVWTRGRLLGVLAVALVAGDLAFFGLDFNTAADPRLLSVTPASIGYVQQDRGLFRVTAYGQDKMLEANGALPYGLQDARGYDSVIIGRYARLNELLEPQDALQFNRVKTLDQPAALRSPLLDLLNVKYIFSQQALEDPKLKQVYAGPDGRVYENLRMLPRAFVVHNVVVRPDAAAQLAAMRDPGFDPGSAAVIDGAPPAEAVNGQGEATHAALVRTYTGRKVVLDASGPGLLVLSDNNFPGWKATVDGQPSQLYTADYAFRGVALGPGEHRVELTFAPLSVIVGGLLSGLSVTLIALALAAFGWRAATRRSRSEEMHPAGRVTKNSLTPLMSNLATKLLSFGFSIYYVRELGAGQVGKYFEATAVWLFLDTIIGFGLQQFVTRDVARDKANANAYVSNAISVRLIVTAAVGLPVVLGVLALQRLAGLPGDTALVIGLLVAGFVPAAFSSICSHVFDAHELMEYKAFIQVLTQVVSVALGVGFILAGWNIVGLATSALLTNVFTAAVFWAAITRRVVRPRFAPDRRLIGSIFRSAFPIMINQLFVVLFFKVDYLILAAFRSNEEVGLYGAAYKFVDAMLLVPATFVPAVFPILSRQAASEREALKRGYDMSLKVLLLVSLPVLAGFEVLAGSIITTFFGQQYAGSIVALRILMLFLPFSYVNGLTQYVLIALDKQRSIVRFFAITAVFNTLVNLALVPSFGYLAASAVTVGSEIVLLVPLYWLTARELGGSSITMAIRPAIASGLAAAAMLLIHASVPAVLGALPGLAATAVAGAGVYVAALILLRTFTQEELDLARRVIGRRSEATVPVGA